MSAGPMCPPAARNDGRVDVLSPTVTTRLTFCGNAAGYTAWAKNTRAI